MRLEQTHFDIVINLMNVGGSYIFV